MLARSGTLPMRGDWAYEVKWDSFRALVSTRGPLRVRSRRGWNMPVRALRDREYWRYELEREGAFRSRKRSLATNN
jgi:hypothetical protein